MSLQHKELRHPEAVKAFHNIDFDQFEYGILLLSVHDKTCGFCVQVQSRLR